MKIPNAVTLKVLIEAYYTGFQVSELNTRSLDSAATFLQKNGLTVYVSDGSILGQLRTTEKGKLFVRQLLQTPMPVQSVTVPS